MTEHNNRHGENAPAQAVILGNAVFRRLRQQRAARAAARRYFAASQEAALQRRLLMRILHARRKCPPLQLVE